MTEQKPLHIKITGDGSPSGTDVLINGHAVCLRGLTYSVTADDYATLTLLATPAAIEVDAEAFVGVQLLAPSNDGPYPDLRSRLEHAVKRAQEKVAFAQENLALQQAALADLEDDAG